MTKEEREEIRRQINSRPLTDFYKLELSTKASTKNHAKYVCPICGSGRGTHQTGALSISKTNRVTCFSSDCFGSRGQDTLGALRILWDCTEQEAFERAGYGQGWKQRSTGADKTRFCEITKTEKPADRTELTRELAAEDYSTFYRQAHKDLLESGEALEYLHGRGISDTSIRLFNIGYVKQWRHSKAPTSRATKRIIVPRSNSAYLARQITAGTYEKMIEGSQRTLFNADALEDPAIDIVHIVEGEFDTMAMYQAGAGAVLGAGSTSNADIVIEAARQHPEKVYILEFDNDEAGHKTQKKVEKALKEAGLACTSADAAEMFDGEKDANAAYIKDPEHLRTAIKAVEEQAKGMTDTADTKNIVDIENTTDTEKDRSCNIASGIDQFIEQVRAARIYEPLPTGITALDRALNGGLIRGTLVTLGAPPAAGKTILAQQIMENMARAGRDCLYINLEMSTAQLYARSLARAAYRIDNDSRMTALDILRGYKWSQEQERLIMKAASLYKAETEPHMMYNPDGVTNGLGSIMNAIEQQTKRAKEAGRPAPLICIDYLQLIDGGERDAAESLKKCIYMLKDHARKNNTVVIVVIANNRTANRSGTVEIDSGRDTSAIEYSGDVMLGLAYSAIEEKRPYKDERNGKVGEYTLDVIRRKRSEAFKSGKDAPKECNEITIKVIKNRFGECDTGARVILDGLHSCINEAFDPY